MTKFEVIVNKTNINNFTRWIVRPCFRCTVNHWAVEQHHVFGEFYSKERTWYFQTEEEAKKFKEAKERENKT